MVYIFISIIVLAISIRLFGKVSGSLALTKLNMISWVFYYNLLLQSFIGSVLIVTKVDNHYLINKLQFDSTRLYGWLSVQYSMIMLPLGMLFVLYAFGLRSNKKLFKTYITSSIKPLLSKKDSYIKIPFYVLSFLSVLSVLYVLASLKSNPLLGILQGLDTLALAGLRQDAGRGFSGNMYVKNIFALGLTPILSYIAFSYYRIEKNRKNLIVFLTLFILSFFILTYDLSKSPLVRYILGFLFLSVVINGGIRKKTLVIFFTSSITLIILMYFAISKVTDPRILFSFNSGIGGRILLSQAAGTYFSFDLFPSNIDHIGLNSISRYISGVFGVEYSERSARLIMEHINPKAVSAGVAGVINSLFIGEAWANFGFMGVLIAPFYVGMVIQIQFYAILKLPKTPVLLGLYIFLLMKNPVTGGFNDYFYNMGMFIVIFIFLLIVSSGKILKLIKRGSL